MHRRHLIAVTGFALALLVGALLLLRAPDSELMAETLPAAQVQVTTAAPRAMLTAPPIHAPDPDVPTTRVLAHTDVTPDLRDHAMRPKQRASGNLWIRGIDAQSRIELQSIRVRAVSPTRIADRTQSGADELTLRLTPDTYSVLVLSPGYEPLEWPVVDLRARVDDEPRIAALRPGSARIEGRVLGSVPEVAGFHAELIGAGRRPCVRCADTSTDRAQAEIRAWTRADPCADCGFTREASRHTLASDGSFAFDRLGSGTYGLRLIDPKGQRDCDVRWVEVRDSEVVAIEFRVPVRRSVRVEILDVDSVSLAPGWSRRLAQLDVGVAVGLQGSVWTCAFRDEARAVARCDFVSPLDGISRPRSFGGRRFGSGGKVGVDDRARANRDTLYPKATTPPVEPIVIACELRGDGFVFVRDLPGQALKLKLACAGFEGTVSIPASDVETFVVAQLEERDDGPLVRSAADSARSVPGTFRAHEAEAMRR